MINWTGGLAQIYVYVWVDKLQEGTNELARKKGKTWKRKEKVE